MKKTDNQKWHDSNKSISERINALMAEMTIEEKLDQLNYRNKAIPRLGIPPYVWWNEALHGLARSGTATVFPQPIGMGATFSPGLVKEMGKVIALEGRARHHESLRKGDFGTYKGLTYCSPNVNIFRDPRWGRGHETYGEDPFLTGLLGAAYVKGIQGNNPNYFKAVAIPKHFAVHSGPEANRLSFDSIADERDLRETYLPAFKACCEAGAIAVMTSYNAYNGVPCSINEYLICKILRNEWGFKGAVITDAGTGEALYKEHKSVSNYAEAAALELVSGVDILIDWEEGVKDAYKRRILKKEVINRALYYQLMIKFKLGFFDDPALVPLANTSYKVIGCDKHRALARCATRKSLVLMKNKDNLLPLKKLKLKSIAVIGPNADNHDVLLGNYYGTPTYQTTILEGILKAALKNCRVWYAKGCEHIDMRTESCAEDYDRISEAVSIAELSDVAVLCLGLSPMIEGEAGDVFNAENSGDRLKIELPEIQEYLLSKVLETGIPVIVLMVCGSSIISTVIEEKVPAMLHCWYPGAEGGDVIAEMLFGDTSPSGRLPVTFYKSTEDLPDFNSYDMSNRTYRFFYGEVAYPFGFGLSYTSFAYSELVITTTDNNLDITVEVSNTGERCGGEVVQVYASIKRDSLRTPIRSLVAIQHVNLKPNEKKQVQFRIHYEKLHITNAEGKQYMSSGECLISVGGSQNDEKSIALMGRKPLERYCIF